MPPHPSNPARSIFKHSSALSPDWLRGVAIATDAAPSVTMPPPRVATTHFLEPLSANSIITLCNGVRGNAHTLRGVTLMHLWRLRCFLIQHGIIVIALQLELPLLCL